MKKKKTISHIVKWLKSYIQTHQLNGMVIGISGGVDSALVSTLCALTELPTLCIEMPIHQSPAQLQRGYQHLEWLKRSYQNTRSLRVELTSTFETLIGAFPPTNAHHHQLALANTRARIRMATLYYFAGLEGLAVTGTGNKIEDFGIGFYTKYGDGGVDLNPIADLMKSEVFELAEFLGIHDAILKAKPTDGLFGDNRSDEEQIGATYTELEWAMLEAEKGKTSQDFTDRQAEVMKIYEYRHKINRHKWNPIPICKIPEDYRD